MTREHYDVIVAGGGSAGLAAAVTAARHGARTLLIERHGALGGMTTSALVHSLCGLYLLRDETETPRAIMAHDGFPAEIATALLQSGDAIGPLRMGRVDLLLHSPPAFALLADRLAAAEPRLTLRLHTELVGVEGDRERLHAVRTLTRGAAELHHGTTFIDTTGDAHLTHLAGAATVQAERLQRPAFIFALGGVAPGFPDGDARLRLARHLVTATRSGALPAGLMGAHFRPGVYPGELYVTIDLDDPPHPMGLVYDPHSPDCLSRLETYGRSLASTLIASLRLAFPPLSAAYLAALPTRVGVRESRRIVGEMTLEASDLLEGRCFPDAVARSTWPLELREQATGPRLRFPIENRPADIPLRALKSRDRGNLFAAGRCLSASHDAQAALRVIGTCLATGEAAGRAAATAANVT